MCIGSGDISARRIKQRKDDLGAGVAKKDRDPILACFFRSPARFWHVADEQVPRRRV